MRKENRHKFQSNPGASPLGNRSLHSMTNEMQKMPNMWNETYLSAALRLTATGKQCCSGWSKRFKVWRLNSIKTGAQASQVLFGKVIGAYLCDSCSRQEQEEHISQTPCYLISSSRDLVFEQVLHLWSPYMTDLFNPKETPQSNPSSDWTSLSVLLVFLQKLWFRSPILRKAMDSPPCHSLYWKQFGLEKAKVQGNCDVASN